MTEKTGYKYSIGFGQSMTSGVLAFHADYSFDGDDGLDTKFLVEMLQKQEKAFADAGYKVASIIPNNLKDLPNSKKEATK